MAEFFIEIAAEVADFVLDLFINKVTIKSVRRKC